MKLNNQKDLNENREGKRTPKKLSSLAQALEEHATTAQLTWAPPAQTPIKAKHGRYTPVIINMHKGDTKPTSNAQLPKCLVQVTAFK